MAVTMSDNIIPNSYRIHSIAISNQESKLHMKSVI